MKAASAFFIALRYLLGRAREGGRYLRGAAAGIALSLIPIIVTLIVADGMIRGITDRYIELGSGHLQIYDYRETEESALKPWDITEDILRIPGVRGAWMEREGLGVLVGAAGSKGATIRAVDKSFWEDEGSREYLKILSGEAELEGGRDVLLGEELARSVGASVGDTVRIMTQGRTQSGNVIPRVAAFTVRGIISSGYRELDALWCVMNFEAGSRILPYAGGIHLTVKIDSPYQDAEFMAEIIRSVTGSAYGIYTWKMIHSAQYSSYESTRQLLLFIMALIVLVAAVNVSFATSMLSIERQRDIAVLKAAGAEPSFTSGIFLWGAFLTGAAGSVLGIAAGLAVGCSVNTLIKALETVLSFFSGLFSAGPVTILDSGYYLEIIPIRVNWKMVVLIGVLTILSSVFASWLPARRAGKLKPIEVLRKH